MYQQAKKALVELKVNIRREIAAIPAKTLANVKQNAEKRALWARSI